MAFGSECSSMMARAGQRFAPKGQQMDTATMVFLALALLIITAPFELSQLAFALVGAVAYALFQAVSQLPMWTQHAASSKAHPAAATSKHAGLISGTQRLGSRPQKLGSFSPARRPHGGGGAAPCTPGGATPGGAGGKTRSFPPAAGRVEYRQPSSQPVAKPSFKATGWEAEVQELISQISPTVQSDKVVQQIADVIKGQLVPCLPEVEVVGFASGELLRGTAFGVAVPEVDIVASACPHVLAARVQGRLVHQLGRGSDGVSTAQQLDERKLQKSAIRFCTDRLVGSGTFKFRRSAFRGQEPKVTLLAPASLCSFGVALPINFSVNSSTPLYNAALLTECGQMEPRAKALILFVKRWAKDRGICHAAKGHLSPYSWTLLVIYFMQVGLPDVGPLLPPLAEFQLSSGLAEAKRGGPPEKWVPPAGGAGKTVGQLFKDFVKFYARDFDFRGEAVSVRAARRAGPGLALPLHVVIGEDGSSTHVAPSIEDPFDTGRNLGEWSTAASLARLREELARADEICTGGASLSELLEPWAPPERGPGGPAGAGEAEEADS